MRDVSRLRDFVQRFTRLVEQHGENEERVFADGAPLLGALIQRDDWLPEAFAHTGTRTYQQNLLYCDPLERFSVVSFVWGPGQSTPVHDHTVWGMIGMMRGVERCEEFSCARLGDPLRAGATHLLHPGQIDKVSPRIGDIHRVSNALADRASISVHVYGGNIGAIPRHVFGLGDEAVSTFVSGYSNLTLPNLWDRSAEARAAMAP